MQSELDFEGANTVEVPFKLKEQKKPCIQNNSELPQIVITPYHKF